MFCGKTFEISAFVFWGKPQRKTKKTTIKKEEEGREFHTTQCIYWELPTLINQCWGKKKELIHADTQKSDN